MDETPVLDTDDKEVVGLGDEAQQLLPQLVAHLREHRTRLREEWTSRIQDAHLLEAMTQQEMAAETRSGPRRCGPQSRVGSGAPRMYGTDPTADSSGVSQRRWHTNLKERP